MLSMAKQTQPDPLVNPNMSILDKSSPAGEDLPSKPLLSKARLSSQQWFQILSTFLVFFNTWGILLTFGVFQTYYQQVLLSDLSSSKISWIATTGAFIVLSAGIITGPLFDRGFYRLLLLSGSILEVFGLMMLSVSSEYYQLFLCQGVAVGLGAGITFTPSVAAASACLRDPATRAKAMGVMACGSSIGGIIYPIMFQSLIAQIGFPWTIRSIAFVVLVLYLVSYLVLFVHETKPLQVRRIFDSSVLADLPFLSISAASLLTATAYYIPQLYLPLLTEAKVQSISPDLEFQLLAILNGASVIGRILTGLIAAAIGPTETIAASLVVGSMLAFCWIAVDSVAGTIVWAVMWGIVSGALVTLPGAYIPLFCPSLNLLGTRSGFLWVWVGLGLLIGPPIGGSIYNIGSDGADDGWHLQIFAGFLMIGAALLAIYPIIYLRRKSRRTSEDEEQ